MFLFYQLGFHNLYKYLFDYDYLFDMVGTEFGIKSYITKYVSIVFINRSIIFPFWKHLSKQKRISNKKKRRACIPHIMKYVISIDRR